VNEENLHTVSPLTVLLRLSGALLHSSTERRAPRAVRRRCPRLTPAAQP